MTHRWPLWRKAVVAVVMLFIVLLVINPEMFAAFGFLLDAALLDAFLIVLVFQLQQLGGGALSYAQTAAERLWRCMPALKKRPE